MVFRARLAPAQPHGFAGSVAVGVLLGNRRSHRLVVWNMAFMTSHNILGIIIYIPADELHHFSEGWLNHQPETMWGPDS